MHLPSAWVLSGKNDKLRLGECLVDPYSSYRLCVSSPCDLVLQSRVRPPSVLYRVGPVPISPHRLDCHLTLGNDGLLAFWTGGIASISVWTAGTKGGTQVVLRRIELQFANTSCLESVNLIL